MHCVWYTVSPDQSCASAEMVIINGRGIVQYNFEATVDEELTVDRGEQVSACCAVPDVLCTLGFKCLDTCV